MSKMPRRSCLTAVTPGEVSSGSASDSIDVVCYAETDEEDRLKLGKEKKLNQDRGGTGEVGDGEESWFTLGYAIERMSFPLRVGADADVTRAVPHMCDDGDDSDSDLAERTDEPPRDEGAQGGLFLDKSMSYALHGGTWSNSVVGAVRDDKNEIYEGSDSPPERNPRCPYTSNCRTFQSVTSMSFNGPEGRRNLGLGSSGTPERERGTPPQSDRCGPKSPSKGPVGGLSVGGKPCQEEREREITPASPNAKQGRNPELGKGKYSSPEGSGCVIN